MNDQRVTAFRKALTSLLDSLDATVRVARWSGPEAVPTPLNSSASKLLDHLASANRFAADRYNGSAPVVACMTAMSAATKVLDGAYVEYRRHMDGQMAELDRAAIALDQELDGVKATSHRWSGLFRAAPRSVARGVFVRKLRNAGSVLHARAGRKSIARR